MKNLFIVGAQRSGSTYLYQLLDEHPGVSMAHPVRPEPKFFLNDELVLKGREYYEREYFKDRDARTIYLGEKSTSYIERDDVARKIKQFYSDARILMILRDPVSRAYSNYRFSVEHKIEDLSFSAALAAEPERLRGAKFSTSVTPFAYRRRGNYIDYIESYLKVFDAKQIRVVIFEEIVGNLQEVQLLYRWLELDDTVVPEALHRVFNSATVPKGNEGRAFRDLVTGYQDSILRLEKFLQRDIDVWREHHKRIECNESI
ncbi:MULTISPECIES: sulfotransferase [Pandoraea]|uniref:Sulfotransferase n=1 Tax=Pandoraea communis TaxID=2508297 RepID=A0A5E4XEA7_9BURK|nr:MULTISPECIES: sulfotransferase [Pandoraea]EON13585.1 sulfotransferase [Pandoraea sp. SD6-2]VVE34637.1 sulfotransferase [Pandoraea communis]